jgi:hypothetical protein
MTVGAWEVFWLILQREMRLSFRRPEQLLQPLVFFLIVTTLFPLGLSLQLSLLRDIAPGVLWVAALLSSLLSLDSLFKSDADDGTLEQLALSGHGLTVIVIAKTVAHWLLTGHADLELAGGHRCGLNHRPATRQRAAFFDRVAVGDAVVDFRRGGNRAGDLGDEYGRRIVFFGGVERAHLHPGAVCGSGGAAHHIGITVER